VDERRADPMKRRRIAQAVVGLALFVLPAILLRVDAVRAVVGSFLAYLRAAGAAGIAVFVGVDLALALVTTPTWLMSGVAGYVWGFGLGMLVALPAVTLVACACFLLSRRFLRGRPLPAVDAAATEGRATRLLRAAHGAVATSGFKVTVLLRLAFVLPQNFMGYLLGTTPLRLRDFAAGTAVGLLPATVVHVYVGTIVVDVAAFLSGDSGMSPWSKTGVIAGAVVVAVFALYLVARLARRALERTLGVTREHG
jgi:uncharacterized membrane protein YdjX (TVP38/TMEM64 family)